MKRHILFLLLLSLSMNPAFAQTYTQDTIHINSVFKSINKFKNTDSISCLINSTKELILKRNNSALNGYLFKKEALFFLNQKLYEFATSAIDSAIYYSDSDSNTFYLLDRKAQILQKAKQIP